MRRFALAALGFVLAACAAESTKEVSLNEKARREWYPGRWTVVCRDLKATYGEAPFLEFKILEPDRIADLRFVYGPAPRYEEHAIPSDVYGPFHGERVIDASSTYLDANEFVINDRFHLFLPPLEEGFENRSLGRDRDSSRQDAAAEVAVNGQRYASIVHLRCVRAR